VAKFFLFKNLNESNPSEILQFPTLRHIFGTESLGRDYFFICLQGAGNSIFIGLFSAFCTLFFGAAVGAYFALRNSFVQNIFLRFLDIFSSIPSFVLASLFAVTVQGFYQQHANPFLTILGALTFSHWMPISRMVYGRILSVNSKMYVEASRILGANTRQILFMHFWPDFREHLLTTFVLQVQANIVYEGFLSYVGLGVQAPETSWGLLIKEGWSYMSDSPHLLVAPAAMLFLFMLFLESFLKYIFIPAAENKVS